MSRLIIISNRVSPATGEGGGNQGGLAVALSAALRESNGLWFGWSGEETESFTGAINFQRADGVATATIDLEAQDIDEYYNGFANQTLWPLFHYRIDLAEFERGFAGGYARVNKRFAETVSPLLDKDDLIWVHDYHLMPLGRELRRRKFQNRIGFFLHIPWPPMRLLISLPSHGELAASLFSYDVVGFQTEDSRDAFIEYVRSQMNDAVIHDDGTVEYKGRRIRVMSCPIGVDCEPFRAAAEGEVAETMRRRMIASANGRTMIIGVDRLDYSKGLAERFLGYERFLSARPEMHGKIFMLQIAPPSRGEVQSYQEIRAGLDNLSGRINGEFSSAEWVPVRYVNRGYPRDELAGMYRASRIGLVTPLRDGMNLVAKEYVVAQDEKDPGVLILSRFAGAAEQMTDALLVNPHSPEEVADAIAQAIAMPLDERQRRWHAMFRTICTKDVMWWWREFTRVLEGRIESAADRAA